MRVTVNYKHSFPKEYEKVKFIVELLDGFRIFLETDDKTYTVLRDELISMQIVNE